MAFPSEIQQQVYDLLSRSSNLAIVPAESVAPTTPVSGQQALSLTPGQRVTAEVSGQPQAGKIPVQIGQHQLNLDLQMAVRQGQSLELTYIGSDPRHTFALARPGVSAPPVSLSDASRLLSLLLSNEQFMDPRLRSSLQSIGDLLRQSSGESSVLAGFLDDFLTYRTDGRAVVTAPGGLLDRPQQQVGDEARQPPGSAAGQTARAAAAFEEAASKLLLNLAQRARLTLVDVTNQPLAPLPLKPGEEANALVQGQLSGGRVLVQLAGESLELQLSRSVTQGEILRLALVTQHPRLVFALLGQPVQDQASTVSEAARWLSSLATQDRSQREVQQVVMARLQQVVASLQPGSSALAAILDEAMIYGASAALSAKSLQNRELPTSGKLDEGMLKLLQGLLQGNRLALVEPQATTPDVFKGLLPGQQLRGEVLQSLGGGRFAVMVGGQSLEALLPKGIRQGDSLRLFFVGDEPPTFLLVRQGREGDALVSQTGRWVSSLLGMQQQNVPLQEGLGILRTLLQGAPSDPAQLEQVLKRGLQESGLFYESHLSRWFSGQYPLERLLQEPQGRFLAQQGELLSKPGGAQSQPAEGSDIRTMPIVKEQLAALQSGQLLFQGELFPGQQLEWRVREREARGGQAEQQDHPWETSISLSLPRLGKIQAVVSLDGARVDLQLEVADAATATMLANQRDGLQEQLLSAGLEPGDLVVKHAP